MDIHAQAPLITAIVPTYKRPRHLRRAVYSILSQSFSNFHILIADNASGSETDQVVQELTESDARVKVLRHPTNLGATANFHTALQHVTTPYVCFLPDDDFYLPTFFERTLTFFIQYPELALCAGEVLLIDQACEIRYPVKNSYTELAKGYFAPSDGMFAYLQSGHNFLLPGIVFKTACIQGVGGFDTRLCVEFDIDVISKCAARFPIYLLPEPVYFTTIDGDHLGTSLDHFAREKERMTVHDNLLSLPTVSEVKLRLETFLMQQHIKHLSIAFKNYCDLKNFAKAYTCAEKIFFLTPTNKEKAKWKRRKRQVSRYAFPHLLLPLYAMLKKPEKMIRGFRSPKSTSVKPAMLDTLSLVPPEWNSFVKQLNAQAGLG